MSCAVRLSYFILVAEHPIYINAYSLAVVSKQYYINFLIMPLTYLITIMPSCIYFTLRCCRSENIQRYRSSSLRTNLKEQWLPACGRRYEVNWRHGTVFQNYWNTAILIHLALFSIFGQILEAGSASRNDSWCKSTAEHYWLKQNFGNFSLLKTS